MGGGETISEWVRKKCCYLLDMIGEEDEDQNSQNP